MNETAGAHHHGAWHGRIEDDPLLRGRGRFSDDVRPYAGDRRAGLARAAPGRLKP